MSKSTFRAKSGQIVYLFTAILLVSLIGGCTVEAAKQQNPNADGQTAKISIAPSSPAETVRVFYKYLREQRFREAMFMTNLRPAIEDLTETDLKDLQIDFAPLAGQIPADVLINGEIISGQTATVTAKLPDNDTDQLALQEIRLRRENNVWVILTVNEEAEKEIEKEGKNYFFTLKTETHQREAKAMLNRIDRAQMVFAMQNKGIYGDIPALVGSKFLPEDIQTPETTGYTYKIYLASDKKSFTATAEPAVYGKTGKLSFWFEVNGGKASSLHNQDNNGKRLDFTK